MATNGNGNLKRTGLPHGAVPFHQMADAQMREAVKSYFPNSIVCSSRVINGVNFVAFDNNGVCRDIFEEQFAAIKREFAKGLPTVLCYHTPFYTKELGDWQVSKVARMKSHDDITEAYLAAPPRGGIKINTTLREWLPRQKNLKAMLCGHKHAESQGLFCENVMQYVAGATYFGNAYDIQFV